MREQELARVAEDLQRWVSLPFAGAWQPSRDRLVLGLGRDALLLLVPRGPLPRVHTIDRRPKNPKKPFSFQGACRAHLAGPLTQLYKPDHERELRLAFGERTLLLRLTGRGGGLWLLHGDDVLAAYDGPTPETLPVLPWLVPRGRPPRFTPAAGETWDDAARRWFTETEARAALEQRRTEVRRALKRRLERTRRLVGALEDDLDRASAAPELRRQADALAAHLHELERGVDHVALQDLEDPARTHHIDIDPTQPPSATMERLYQRARRLDRVADQVVDKLVASEELAERLERALVEVETASWTELSTLKALAPTAASRAPADERQAWDTWIGPEGATVLVGRNERSNRALTFQRAHGRDFWMHLRDRPGAHLVLPMKPGQTPSGPLLLAAAQIALLTAKIAEGSAADVQYTRVKHVRSIPGDPGARVLVHEEKVLHVKRDPAALVGWRRV